MAEFVGSGAYITWIYSGGTVVLSGDYRSIKPSEEVKVADGSAGSDTAMVKYPTLADGKTSIELVQQTGGTVLFNSLAPNTTGTLIVGKEGTASGKPKATIAAFVAKREEDIQYDDVVVLNVDFEHQGAVVYSSY